MKELGPTEKPIYVGNNAIIYARGRGDIQVKTFVNGQWEPHMILDVLYIPAIGKNLFSLGAAADKGVSARIEKDNAKEFVSAEVKALFRKNTIVHELYTPYTPQQNGRAERQNRTIVESGRSLLHSSGLPQSLWAEMVNVAVYTRNMVPSERLAGQTPFKLWHGKRLDVGHLRIIGSDAYALTNEQFGAKFEAKSQK